MTDEYIDPGDDEAKRAYVERRRSEAEGPEAAAPVELLVLLTQWHEDEVTDVPEAYEYARRFVTMLDHIGLAVVPKPELELLLARPWGVDED